jgi:hypothetical protein
MSATINSGNLYAGSKLTLTGMSPSLATTAYATNGSYTLSAFSNAAIASGTSGTGFLGSYQAFVQTLLTRGFKVRWAAEIAWSASTTDGAARLRSKILNNAISDVTAAIGSTLAANLKVWDLTQIQVSGSQVFGTAWNGNATNLYYLEGVHPTPTGMTVLASGGDVASAGFAYQLTH